MMPAMSEQLQPIDLNHPALTFAGAISVEPLDDGAVQPWRLDWQRKPLFDPTLKLRAESPAGVRLSFVSDTSAVRLGVRLAERPDEWDGWYDLFVDGELHERLNGYDGDQTLLFEGIPDGEHRLELWLAQYPENAVTSLAIDEGASLQPFEDDRPRWVTYGSSITHNACAFGPSETWPSLVARAADVHLTNLGFGGACHFDPIMGLTIRDTPADMISLKLGINVYGSGSHNERSFAPAITGLLLNIREKHPDTPVAVISPIFSNERETEQNKANLTLVQMREILLACVEAMKSCGDEHIAYFDGLAMLGESGKDYLHDQLHPDQAGQHYMAKGFLREVAPWLGMDVKHPDVIREDVLR